MLGVERSEVMRCDTWMQTADRAATKHITDTTVTAFNGAEQQEALIWVKLTCREAEGARLFGMARTPAHAPFDWVAEPMSKGGGGGGGQGESYASPDDAKPPVGFEFVPGSTWPQPEQWTYGKGGRENVVHRRARCTATVMQPARVDVPSPRRESVDDPGRRFDARGTFSLFLSATARVPT